MLEFKNVSYQYPHRDTFAVKDVSFSVNAGEMVLFTGKSGCGKSTLLRLANGLAPHILKGSVQGEVLIEGQSTKEYTPASIARFVGSLSQDPETQFFALTVRDEIALSMQWRDWTPDQISVAIQNVVQELGIEHLLDQTIFGLSEGQKQKVALASLLVLKPKFLLLDEPSANLDPESTLALGDLLVRLAKQGMGIMVVDHRLAWLHNKVDRVVILENGSIQEQGNFELLLDAQRLQKYGLRSSSLHDPRETLPLQSLQVFADAFFACKNIDFAYKQNKTIFTQFSACFEAGKVTALLGDNGTGKTTLSRILVGLEKPQSGAVFSQNQPIARKKLSAHAQVVLQNAGHQLRMNAVDAELLDALKTSPLFKKGKNNTAAMQQIVDETLHLYGLENLRARHPQSLSGGEKQRLAIACATIRQPQMLILDEPTSGLDGENMQRIAKNIEHAKNNGASIVVITHDLELMRCVCDYKLVLKKQEIVPALKQHAEKCAV